MHKRTKIITAQEFRKNSTKSEKIMWNALRNRQFMDLKFRRQHIIEGYILDFYCHSYKLAVEIDGSVHLNKEQIVLDRERQEQLEKLGIRFFRIASGEVERDIRRALSKLQFFIKKLYP